MKLMALFILYLPLFAQAMSSKECTKKITQAEKNECMALLKDEAIGNLVRNVSIYCSEKNEIKESEGGTIYPMLLDQCLEEEFRHLNRIFNQIKD